MPRLLAVCERIENERFGPHGIPDEQVEGNMEAVDNVGNDIPCPVDVAVNAVEGTGNDIPCPQGDVVIARQNIENNKQVVEKTAGKQVVEKTPNERERRLVKLGDKMRSPYILLRVDISEEMTSIEVQISNSIFSMEHEHLDVLFETKDGRHGSREIFESMLPTTAIAADVINVWSYILNHEERRKNKDSPSWLFFGTDILMDYLITKEKVTNKELYDSFLGGLHAASNGNGETASLKKIDLVFFPVHKTNHFYLIVFNLKSPEFLIIDNIAGDANISSQYGKTPTVFKKVLLHHLKAVQHPRLNSVGNLRARRLRMQWRTLFNGVDCGIFVMRHMETYMGESDAKWNCGLVNESNEQEQQLNKLRGKYLAKMLFSGVNLKRDFVIMQAEEFASRDSSEQRNIIDYAFENRHVRFSQLCPSTQS